jgi:membrane-associated protease RseP (regulator of RpoE activity)
MVTEMLVALFIVLTLLFIWVMTALYCLTMALVGRAAGISVERCAVGIGPTVSRLTIRGIPIVVKPIPFSGRTKFRDRGDDAPFTSVGGNLMADDAAQSSDRVQFDQATVDSQRDVNSPDSFQAASYPVRVAVLLSGPLTSILLGLVLLALPVWAKAEKRLARFGGGELIEPSGVPDLRLETSPPSDTTQLQAVRQTAGDYFTRMISFRPLEGWGGYVACVVTSAVIASQSPWGWITCMGIVALSNGCLSLLPIPLLNGGRLVLETVGAVFAPVGERAFTRLSMIGLALILMAIGRMIWLDVTWLVGLL